MSVNDTLREIGLSEKEAKLYLALLKHGKMKPSSLASLTKISRPLVYTLAKGLLSKGIISEDISGKTLYFIPLPPDNLEGLIRDIKREAKEKESSIRKAMGELSLIMASKQYPIPKIRLVEEKDLEKFLFDNLTKWQDEVIASGGVWWGFQDHSFVENYEKWINSTWETKQSKHAGYKAQVFTNASKIEQKLEQKYPKSKRDMRFMDGVNFTGTTWICGEYLIMIMTQEHPFYLLEIHDRLLAHNTAEVFKKLWNK